MKTKGIVFDCDGTIVDSVEVVIASIHYALRKVNAPDHSSSEIHSLFGPGADEILRKLIGDEAKAKEAYEHYLESQKENVFEMKVYEGIRAMLEEIKKNKIPCAMVTGRHSRDLEVVLKAHQLEEYFEVVVADDELKKPKPSPEGLELAAEELAIPVSSLLYVGDGEGDIETSHRAGARVIAALWDTHVEKEKLLKKGPDFTAKTPADVTKIILSETRAQTSMSFPNNVDNRHRDFSRPELPTEEHPSH